MVLADATTAGLRPTQSESASCRQMAARSAAAPRGVTDVRRRSVSAGRRPRRPRTCGEGRGRHQRATSGDLHCRRKRCFADTAVGSMLADLLRHQRFRDGRPGSRPVVAVRMDDAVGDTAASLVPSIASLIGRIARKNNNPMPCFPSCRVAGSPVRRRIPSRE